MHSTPLTRLERLVLSACFAVLLAWVSGNLHSRFEHREQQVANESAVLHQQLLHFDDEAKDFPEFRNRLLMPALMEAAAPIAGGPQKAFIALRVVSALVMMLVWFCVMRDVAWPMTLLGAAVLAGVVTVSFAHGFEATSDFPDVAFMLAFVALVRERRFTVLAGLALAATFNRESSAFAGVLWACAYGSSTRSGRRAIVQGVALSVSCYALALGLRHVFALPGGLHERQMLGILALPQHLADFVRRPSPTGWPMLLASVWLLTGVLLKRSAPFWTGLDRRILLAAALIVIPTVTFGIASEIRVWLPVFALCLQTATLALGRRQTSTATLAQRDAA